MLQKILLLNLLFDLKIRFGTDSRLLISEFGTSKYPKIIGASRITR